jgi:hypothetical protein
MVLDWNCIEKMFGQLLGVKPSPRAREDGFFFIISCLSADMASKKL